MLQLVVCIIRPSERFFRFAVNIDGIHNGDSRGVVGWTKRQDQFLIGLQAFFLSQRDVEPAVSLQDERNRPKSSTYDGARWTSRVPTNTRTPTMTVDESALVISIENPVCLVQATYNPAVFSRCLSCAELYT